MGRGHKCDFDSYHAGSSPTLERMAHKRAEGQGPTDLLVCRLRTVEGVPVGNRGERRMAARELRRRAREGGA